MASALYENIPEEHIRNIGYDVIMTGVFGEHHNDWGRKKYDLIRAVTSEEVKNTYGGIFELLGPAKFVRLSSDASRDTVYCCTYDKIALNHEGINERNYNDLKNLYSAAENLRVKTAGKPEKEKYSIIHDYIADSVEGGTGTSTDEFCAARGLSAGVGTCETYTVLMYLFGRYCGLEVGIIRYQAPGDTVSHTLNTGMLDGSLRYIDVTWDDALKTSAYFLQTEAEFMETHPQ